MFVLIRNTDLYCLHGIVPIMLLILSIGIGGNAIYVHVCYCKHPSPPVWSSLFAYSG